MHIRHNRPTLEKLATMEMSKPLPKKGLKVLENGRCCLLKANEVMNVVHLIETGQRDGEALQGTIRENGEAKEARLCREAPCHRQGEDSKLFFVHFASSSNSDLILRFVSWQGKGKNKKVGADQFGLPIYKWKKERKA